MAYKYISHAAIWFNGTLVSMKLPCSHDALYSYAGVRKGSALEGFLDNDRNFINREEAARLAFNSGQLRPTSSGYRKKKLYVDDLILN